MTLDAVTHTVVIEGGDYAGTYTISDENWQVYSSGIVFIWSGESFRLERGFAPDYELPTRSGALFVYQEDDEGNSQVIDVYKLWKESESGGSTIATPYQVHTDQIGAPVLLTDATGTAVWSAQYAPFGQATINNDVDGDGTEVICNLRFPGQYFDAESGLHYNWHRYYEPRSGRYVTLGPIGLDGGINLYAYVGGNPVNRFDPFGLREWTVSRTGFSASLIIVGGSFQKVTFESNCGDGYKIIKSYLVLGIGLKFSMAGPSRGMLGGNTFMKKPNPLSGITVTGPSLAVGYGGSLGSASTDFNSYGEAYGLSHGWGAGASFFDLQGQYYLLGTERKEYCSCEN